MTTTPRTYTALVTSGDSTLALTVDKANVLDSGHIVVTAAQAAEIADAWTNQGGDLLREWRTGTAKVDPDVILAEFSSASGLSVDVWPALGDALLSDAAYRRTTRFTGSAYSTAAFPRGPLPVVIDADAAAADRGPADEDAWADIPAGDTRRIDGPVDLGFLGVDELVSSMELCVSDDGVRRLEAVITVDLTSLGDDDYLNGHNDSIEKWVTEHYSDGPLRGGALSGATELIDGNGEWSYQFVTFHFSGDLPTTEEGLASVVIGSPQIERLHNELTSSSLGGFHNDLARHLNEIETGEAPC